MPVLHVWQPIYTAQMPPEVMQSLLDGAAHTLAALRAGRRAALVAVKR